MSIIGSANLFPTFVPALLSVWNCLSPWPDHLIAHKHIILFSVSAPPFVIVQSLSHVRLFVTLWTEARQASLSFTISRSLLKLMSTESVMTSNYLILCHSLLLLPSIFLRIRIFSDESSLRIRWPKYWSFSISLSMNIQG